MTGASSAWPVRSSAPFRVRFCCALSPPVFPARWYTHLTSSRLVYFPDVDGPFSRTLRPVAGLVLAVSLAVLGRRSARRLQFASAIHAGLHLHLDLHCCLHLDLCFTSRLSRLIRLIRLISRRLLVGRRVTARAVGVSRVGGRGRVVGRGALVPARTAGVRTLGQCKLWNAAPDFFFFFFFSLSVFSFFSFFSFLMVGVLFRLSGTSGRAIKCGSWENTTALSSVK